MVSILNQCMTFIGSFLSEQFYGLLNFLLGMLPTYTNAYGGLWITNMFNSMVAWVGHGNGLVFWFFRLDILAEAFAVAISMVVVSCLVKFVIIVIRLIHDVLDSIPVIG